MKPEMKTPVDCATGAEKNISNKLSKNNYNDKFLKVKPVTKAEIISAFGDTLSSSAIQLINGEYEVVGKFCRIIIFDDGHIDLWLCNPTDMFNGLSKKKLNRLVDALEVPVESTFNDKTTKSISFNVLDGEAWLNLDLPDLILKNLKLLGIRKKRELSPIQKQSLVERLQGETV